MRRGGLDVRTLSLFGSSLLLVLSTTATPFAAPAGDATTTTLGVSVTVVVRCTVDVPASASIGSSDVSISCGRSAHNQTPLITTQSSSTAPIPAAGSLVAPSNTNESPTPAKAGETTVVTNNF